MRSFLACILFPVAGLVLALVTLTTASTAPPAIARHVFKASLSRYSAFASARPVTSNVIQGGVLFTGGDLIAQALQPELDPSKRTALAKCTRALNSGVFGAAYVGGVVCNWYRLMDRVVKPHLGKVAGNCLALGIGGNAANMYTRRVARTGCPDEAWSFTGQNIGQVVKHDFQVWPAFDIILFSCVPQHLRPAAASAASMVWNTYISMKSNASS